MRKLNNWIRLLIFTFAPIAVGAATVPSSDRASLALAMRRLFLEEKVDDKTVLAVESTFARATDPETKIFAAYFLTFPQVKSAAGPWPYVDYVLGQPDSKGLLGRGAMVRVLRLRADESYRKGNFKQAEADFAQLKKLSEGLLGEYASLKLGWTYLNKNQAAQAFDHWLAETKEMLVKKSNPPTAHLRGLGQSLAENTGRGEAQFRELGALPLDASQKEAVIQGFTDGLDYLVSEEAMAEVAKQARALSWNQELVDGIFDRSGASANRACHFLGWLDVGDQSRPLNQKYGRVVEACSQWVGKMRGARMKVPPTYISQLAKAMPRLQLQGKARRFRFDYVYGNGATDAACLEGIDWLSDPVEEAERNAAPVKLIAQACEQFPAKASADTKRRLVEKFHHLAKSGKHLRTENDPLLYILAGMIKTADFRAALVQNVANDSSTYRPTLLPTLLAEKLYLEKDFAGAESLLKTYAGKAPPAPSATPTADVAKDAAAPKAAQPAAESKESTPAIWKRIALERIAQLITAGKLAEAHKLLDEQAPLNEQTRTQPEVVRLWLAFLWKCRDDKNFSALIPAKAALITTSETMRQAPDVAPAILELAASLGQWTTVWNLLKAQSGTTVSEKLIIELFTTIADGKLEPAGWETLPRGQVRALAELGLAFRTPGKRAAESLPAEGSSRLSKDVTYLKVLDERKKAALTPRRKRESVEQILAWVNFLDRYFREVHKRPWIHTRLREAGLIAIADFCRRAESSATELNPSEQLNPEQWDTLLKTLTQRLRDCRQKLSAQDKEQAS